MCRSHEVRRIAVSSPPSAQDLSPLLTRSSLLGFSNRKALLLPVGRRNFLDYSLESVERAELGKTFVVASGLCAGWKSEGTVVVPDSDVCKREKDDLLASNETPD